MVLSVSFRGKAFVSLFRKLINSSRQNESSKLACLRELFLFLRLRKKIFAEWMSRFPRRFLTLFDFVLRSSSRNDLFFRNGITLSIRPGEILVGWDARNIGKYICVIFAWLGYGWKFFRFQMWFRNAIDCFLIRFGNGTTLERYRFTWSTLWT